MNTSLLILGGLVLSADPVPGQSFPGIHHPAHSPLPAMSALLLSEPAAPHAADLRWQAACPTSMVQPFHRLPHVRPVGPCNDQPGEARPPVKPYVWEFHQAAHFPIPRFCPDGSPLALDGLLIYEGMRLTVDSATGTYDVEFTATVPDMPVTVRLQLLLSREEQPEREFRLTLPPIRLEPPRNGAAGDPSANDFHVHHRGYTTQFRHSAPEIGATLMDGAWTVKRIGSARFGTPLAPVDTYR